jgi:hypothetical protein
MPFHGKVHTAGAVCSSATLALATPLLLDAPVSVLEVDSRFASEVASSSSEVSAGAATAKS